MNVALFTVAKSASTYLSRNLELQEGVKKIEQYNIGTYDFAEGEFDKINSESLTISCIRHPVERLFSALYYSERVYHIRKKRGFDNNSKEAKAFDELSIEEKIKKILSFKFVESLLPEVQSCKVGFLEKNYDIFYKLDELMFHEEMEICISDFNKKYKTSLNNKIVAGYGEKHPFEELTKSLKGKYLDRLSELYSKDIECYFDLKNKFL